MDRNASSFANAAIRRNDRVRFFPREKVAHDRAVDLDEVRANF
jgi:hypothetical protein